MKEVRPPKRPLIFYYCVAMLILLLFNFLAMPWMARQQIQEVVTAPSWTWRKPGSGPSGDPGAGEPDRLYQQG